MKHTVYIALGTNLGDREQNLRSAIEALSPDVSVVAESPIYQTAPWGYEDQPDFLNQVVEGQTNLPPAVLLARLKEIESALGRRPTFRNGPRVVDLDILFYGDMTIEQPGLIIPHPRLQERAFVLVPLADLAPDLHHPVLGHTVREMLAEADRDGVEIFTGCFFA